MDHRAAALLLAASLLILAPAGCGKSNTLSRIVVTPAAPVVAKGTVQQLSVLAIFSDGMTVPSWQVVTWASSDPLVATISTSGAVAGVKAGTAVITATDVGHPDITCSVTVSVTELTAITVSPVSAAVSMGTASTQQFTATGIYAAGTPTAWNPSYPDITALVAWASSDTAVAVVSTLTGTRGIATVLTAGTATITATDLATRITGTASLTVVP